MYTIRKSKLADRLNYFTYGETFSYLKMKAGQGTVIEKTNSINADTDFVIESNY